MELEILEMSKYSAFGKRDRGTGRPTKKDRRDMQEYFEPSLQDEEEEWYDFSDDDDM
mgnify:FL=1